MGDEVMKKVSPIIQCSMTKLTDCPTAIYATNQADMNEP